MQRLILPFKKNRVSAGYGNEEYRKFFGFAHYGMDLGSDDADYNIYALGSGEVAACGQDGTALTGANARLGNVLVIIYRDVLRNDGLRGDLVCRMFHLERILCKAGDRVQTGDIIGHYGNTGANTTGAHLHIEFDTDVQYPLHAFGISDGGRIIRRGTVNSSVNPVNVWFRGTDQSIRGADAGDCYTAADLAAPPLPDPQDCQTLFQEEHALRAAAEADRDLWKAKYRELREAIARLIA